MIRKFSSRRPCTAARMRRTASSVSTTCLPSRWPQRLGLTWSSMWQPSSPAAVRGGAGAAYGILGLHHLFAFQVAAALGVALVLDVAAGQAGVLEHLDRAGHVHRFAESGVGIDDRGPLAHPGDLPGPGGD